MKTLVLLALLGLVNSEVVDISCSDNATCIENIPRTLVRSIRQRKTVRLFDTFTIEPLDRQARGNLDPLSRLVRNHAISFDWDDFTFRFSAPEGRSDALDLEVLESRTVKDVSEAVPKKSKKEDEEVVDDKSKKIQIRRRRRVKRKVFQALVPLLFGMKSTGIVIFGLGMVTVITLKAFMASKLALIVTVGMALKKLYESYGSGYGLQNPYLYSQYPIDFPSASSHAYSISGVSPQFASPEMYSPTGLATHANEMLQSHDASAQQSQQAPTVLNSTRAAERWDGKSKLLKYFEPIVSKIKSVVDPIASVFFDAMPDTFRGRNSDLTTAKSVEEESKKPREFLVPQPRHIAQRKMTRKGQRNRPKKYVEYKIDLNRLKHNKDFQDYVKTKKYKHNYPNTYYYPRIRYFMNPNTVYYRPNTRMYPYSRNNIRRNFTVFSDNDADMPLQPLFPEPTDWRPIIIFNTTTTTTTSTVKPNESRKKMRKNRRKRIHKKRKRTRTRRSIDNSNENINTIQTNENLKYPKDNATSRGILSMFNLFEDPFVDMIKETKSVIHGPPKKPPRYYSLAYNMLLYTMDFIDGFIEVHEVIRNHLEDDDVKIKKITKKKPIKVKKDKKVKKVKKDKVKKVKKNKVKKTKNPKIKVKIEKISR